MDKVEWLRPARGVTYDVLVGGPDGGVPVLLVHGNCSSAEFWLPLIRRLPDGIRVVAPHLRRYGRSEAAPVEATRGLRDFADDVAALLDDRVLFPQDGPVVAVGQTRAVLQRYAGAGGSFREVVYDNCGHSPHLERPAEFTAELLQLINNASG